MQAQPRKLPQEISPINSFPGGFIIFNPQGWHDVERTGSSRSISCSPSHSGLISRCESAESKADETNTDGDQDQCSCSCQEASASILISPSDLGFDYLRSGVDLHLVLRCSVLRVYTVDTPESRWRWTEGRLKQLTACKVQRILAVAVQPVCWIAVKNRCLR